MTSLLPSSSWLRKLPNVWVGGYWLRGDAKRLVCTEMAKKRYKAFKTNICSLKEAESEDQWVARTNA